MNYDFAIDKAVEILSRANYPLISGLNVIGTRAQQIAVNIGRRIGGAVDASLANAARAPTFAIQREGMITATLGEVAQRAELVIFWFCDPVITHPRLIERYCQRQNQRFIVVDQTATETSKIADKFIRLGRLSGPVAMRICEGILAGIEFDADRVHQQTGQSLDAWKELVDELRGCSYTALFYGCDMNTDPSRDVSVDCLVSFAKQLSAETRFVLFAARRDQNALSAENVLAWSTGYAVAVDTCRQHPRSNYLEFSAERVLDHGECDSVMLFVDEASSHQLCDKFVENFKSIPTIVISEPSSEMINLNGTEVLSVACDLKLADDFCRLDDVLLPFQPFSGKLAAANGVNRFLLEISLRLK